jgi:hypothetical protein
MSMRTAKPSLIEAFLALMAFAGILGLAFGTSRVQTGGVVAIVLAMGVAAAIRPRPQRSRRG